MKTFEAPVAEGLRAMKVPSRLSRFFHSLPWMCSFLRPSLAFATSRRQVSGFPVADLHVSVLATKLGGKPQHPKLHACDQP